MKKLLLALFVFTAANAFAQDYVVTNDGQRITVNINQFDIFTVVNKTNTRDAYGRRNFEVYDTSFLSQVQINGMNFDLTRFQNNDGWAHAFLPTDNNLQNVEIKCSLTDIKKYNAKNITFYEIKLAPNGANTTTAYLLGGVYGAIDAARDSKKNKMRTGTVTLLLIQKDNGDIVNLLSIQKNNRGIVVKLKGSELLNEQNECWNLLKTYFSDDFATETTINQLIERNTPPNIRNLRKLILNYIGNPKIKEIDL